MRNLKFIIDSFSEPLETQKVWGGMQYEDSATTVSFKLADNLLENIGTPLYRIDFNGMAGYNPSENLSTDGDGFVSRTLPYSMTSYGGDIEVVFVVCAEITEVFAYPVKLFLTDVARDNFAEDKVHKSISDMEESVKQLSKEVENAVDTTNQNTELSRQYMNETINSRFALENGAEFVFSGGNAENTGSANIVVDAELSEISTNPIENKAVANKFKGYMTKAQVEEALEEAIRSAKQLAISAVYPIGSYYWSSVSTEPSTLFGGIWERVKDRFLLACGDTYSNNETGGESTVTLKVLEMPKHTHEFTIRQNSEAGGVGYVMVGNQYDNPQQVTTTEAGESQPHNNMPPYYAAYCWHRIG